MVLRADVTGLPFFLRAEKKIISAASKLAAMAKVLETPIKSKSGKNHSLPSESCSELLIREVLLFLNINLMCIDVLYRQVR